MALRTLLKFRNLDSTKDLNDRYRDLILRGVFDGGDVLPVTSQLKVDVTPFKLVADDGMVVIETSDTERLTVLPGQTNVIAFRSGLYFSAS